MLLISDGSDKVCERIIQTDLHADMLEKLSCRCLSAATLNDSQSNAQRNFVQCCVGILHNVVRRITTSREVFRKCQAVDNLYEFCDVTNYPVIFLFSSLICLQ